MRRAIGYIVDASGRRPLTVLAIVLCVLAVTWHFALKVLSSPHTDLRELLPTDSPGLKAFEHQLGRVGGGATLLVVVESPDRADNERFADDLGRRLQAVAASEGAAGLVAYVESGTKDVHAFFEKNKWLYADESDLRAADEEIDRQIALRSGMVEDLEGGGAPAKPALGVEDHRERWSERARRLDDFPGGYFETADGAMVGLRIVSRTTGMGDAGGDRLLGEVQRVVAAMRPESYHPAMRVGFAGDIPNAAAEKRSIVSQAAWASGVALLLIAAGVVWFYGSVWSLPVIALPALLGVGAAYAFAYFRFGYVNTTGMFLGAIILGNGVNYPIVLLARYREFVARGVPPAAARRQAVQNALRAELVGACVASIAYGSLTLTQFRGFSQFGWIGFVGMLLVWISMIPCVPALVAVIERLQTKLPPWLRDRPPRAGFAPPRRLLRRFAGAAERAPWALLCAAAVPTAAAALKVPAFFRDPWEYNFDRLGSKESKHGGAGEWSNKADAVFGGKMNVAGALMLADTADQVPIIKQAILANDAADAQGRLVADVATVDDLLPGTPLEQERKLEILARIRGRLTGPVVDGLPADERARLEELRPPDDLRVLRPRDLPALLRRRFEENDGRLGTVFYVKLRNDVSLSDGHNLLRIARTTDNVRLPDGSTVQTASRATVFAEMIRSMHRDGPRATAASLLAVSVVVVLATRDARGAFVVLASLLTGVAWLVGGAAWLGERLNYVNFIVLPITFGIGCEYPFNVYDRSRLLGGDVSGALERVGGAVALCSYTTVVGYGALLFADFQALQSFGRLAVSGELACVTAALLFTPAVLRVIARVRGSRASVPADAPPMPERRPEGRRAAAGQRGRPPTPPGETRV